MSCCLARSSLTGIVSCLKCFVCGFQFSLLWVLLFLKVKYFCSFTAATLDWITCATVCSYFFNFFFSAHYYLQWMLRCMFNSSFWIWISVSFSFKSFLFLYCCCCACFSLIDRQFKQVNVWRTSCLVAVNKTGVLCVVYRYLEMSFRGNYVRMHTTVCPFSYKLSKIFHLHLVVFVGIIIVRYCSNITLGHVYHLLVPHFFFSIQPNFNSQSWFCELVAVKLVGHHPLCTCVAVTVTHIVIHLFFFCCWVTLFLWLVFSKSWETFSFISLHDD